MATMSDATSRFQSAPSIPARAVAKFSVDATTFRMLDDPTRQQVDSRAQIRIQRASRAGDGIDVYDTDADRIIMGHITYPTGEGSATGGAYLPTTEFSAAWDLAISTGIDVPLRTQIVQGLREPNAHFTTMPRDGTLLPTIRTGFRWTDQRVGFQSGIVLLHEYGHAILWNIAGERKDRDYRTIHEGFADAFAYLTIAWGVVSTGAFNTGDLRTALQTLSLLGRPVGDLDASRLAGPPYPVWDPDANDNESCYYQALAVTHTILQPITDKADLGHEQRAGVESAARRLLRVLRLYQDDPEEVTIQRVVDHLQSTT